MPEYVPTGNSRTSRLNESGRRFASVVISVLALSILCRNDGFCLFAFLLGGETPEPLALLVSVLLTDLLMMVPPFLFFLCPLPVQFLTPHYLQIA